MGVTWDEIPGSPVFQRATLKNWEWPGDEAMEHILRAQPRSCMRVAYKVLSMNMFVCYLYIYMHRGNTIILQEEKSSAVVLIL